MNLDSDKHNVQALTRALVCHGVRHVVLSPGSRNAPLIISTSREESLETSIVIDERSAAFIALGMAAQSRKPVALICTSGSAVLNYAPAVAEAYYREIPIIVISADRPRQWIDQDDSQTIRQPEILRNIVKHSCDIDVDSTDSSLRRMAVRDINDTLIAATSGRQGPVHINIHLDIPLGNLAEKELIKDSVSAVLPPMTMPMAQVRSLARELNGKRVLVICGFMAPDRNLSRGISRMASVPNIAVMIEAQSNIHGRGLIRRIDTTLSSMSLEEKEDMAPDVVITLGGSLVSRFVKGWLRKVPGLEHWHIGMRGMSVDPFNALTRRIEMDPEAFIPLLASACIGQHEVSDYGLRWRTIASEAEKRGDEYAAHAEWSDLSALYHIISNIPTRFNLQLSNGTAVRYCQLFGYGHIHRIDSNRGVSGIDGSTSTALGASVLYDDPTLLITGDMSAQYDIAALGSNLVTPKFKIIVLSNGGGGIFRFIGLTKKAPELESCLGSQINFPVEKLAEAYGFSYFRAEDSESLSKEFNRFCFESEKPAVLEVVTDGELSAEILNDYFKNLQKH